MPTAKSKRIAALEKAAGSIARRGRRPGQFTIEGLISLLIEVRATEVRELVMGVLDARPLPGRERLCETVRIALCALLSANREGYRAACIDLRAAAAAEAEARAVLEAEAEAARPAEVELAPLSPRGEQLVAEIESLPDAVLSDSDVEEVRRRLPGEGPVRIPGVDPPDMRGWRPLGNSEEW